MLLVFQNKDNIWICLGFVRYRFVKCRIVRSKIYTFRFVCFQDLLKTSSRHAFKTSSIYVFKTSWRHVFKTSWRHLQRNNFSSSKTSSRGFARCLQDVFKTSLIYVFKTSSRHVFKTSSRRLQRNNFSSSKTSSRGFARCLQDVFKTSLRRLHKTSWKTKNCCSEDVLMTFSRRLGDQQMFAGNGFTLTRPSLLPLSAASENKPFFICSTSLLLDLV